MTTVIQLALTANGIMSVRIDQSAGQKSAANRFRNDPSILVLLLHGCAFGRLLHYSTWKFTWVAHSERENAGLNVTCASRVFMVESVVQHAFEIQGPS